MEELAKKISEYQIFNFLLPGAVFAALVTKTTNYNLVLSNVILALSVYYFLGLVISRCGSLVISPLIKMLKIVKFAPYPDFLRASKTDAKLDMLSQENNMYRSFISMFAIYLAVFLYSKNIFNINDHINFDTAVLVLTLLGLLVFTLAYRKQTHFITKRIRTSSSSKMAIHKK
jgi:hypothetical protein